MKNTAVSSAFIWRRVHSLMGLWLVLFLSEHLIVNSQAALWIGDDGHTFVRLVNSLESLPFLYVIEAVLIGFPFAVHMVWGVRRIFQAKTNSGGSDGSTPSLNYGRNRSFTWQRLSSWILLFGVIAHVGQMRFYEYPEKVVVAGKERWLVEISYDDGLKSLSKRLGVEMKVSKDGMVQATGPDVGTAMLLVVRNAFKSPLQIALYTIFVLAAAFHAFNGFWTFLISWGTILSYRSQKAMIPLSVIGICLLAFLGLAAIWGTYWVNLRV